MAIYTLSYDSRRASSVNPKIISFVKNNRLVDEWSSPFDGLFFLKSDAEKIQLIETFIEFLEGTSPFFLAKYEPGAGGGSMPSSGWEWIRTHIGAVQLFNESDEQENN